MKRTRSFRSSAAIVAIALSIPVVSIAAIVATSSAGSSSVMDANSGSYGNISASVWLDTISNPMVQPSHINSEFVTNLWGQFSAVKTGTLDQQCTWLNTLFTGSGADGGGCNTGVSPDCQSFCSDYSKMTLEQQTSSDVQSKGTLFGCFISGGGAKSGEASLKDGGSASLTSNETARGGSAICTSLEAAIDANLVGAWTTLWFAAKYKPEISAGVREVIQKGVIPKYHPVLGALASSPECFLKAKADAQDYLTLANSGYGFASGWSQDSYLSRYETISCLNLAANTSGSLSSTRFVINIVPLPGLTPEAAARNIFTGSRLSQWMSWDPSAAQSREAALYLAAKNAHAGLSAFINKYASRLVLSQSGVGVTLLDQIAPANPSLNAPWRPTVNIIEVTAANFNTTGSFSVTNNEISIYVASTKTFTFGDYGWADSTAQVAVGEYASLLAAKLVPTNGGSQQPMASPSNFYALLPTSFLGYFTDDGVEPFARALMDGLDPKKAFNPRLWNFMVPGSEHLGLNMAISPQMSLFDGRYPLNYPGSTYLPWTPSTFQGTHLNFMPIFGENPDLSLNMGGVYVPLAFPAAMAGSAPYDPVELAEQTVLGIILRLSRAYGVERTMQIIWRLHANAAATSACSFISCTSRAFMVALKDAAVQMLGSNALPFIQDAIMSAGSYPDTSTTISTALFSRYPIQPSSQNLLRTAGGQAFIGTSIGATQPTLQFVGTAVGQRVQNSYPNRTMDPGPAGSSYVALHFDPLSAIGPSDIARFHAVGSLNGGIPTLNGALLFNQEGPISFACATLFLEGTSSTDHRFDFAFERGVAGGYVDPANGMRVLDGAVLGPRVTDVQFDGIGTKADVINESDSSITLRFEAVDPKYPGGASGISYSWTFQILGASTPLTRSGSSVAVTFAKSQVLGLYRAERLVNGVPSGVAHGCSNIPVNVLDSYPMIHAQEFGFLSGYSDTSSRIIEGIPKEAYYVVPNFGPIFGEQSGFGAIYTPPQGAAPEGSTASPPAEGAQFEMRGAVEQPSSGGTNGIPAQGFHSSF